MATSTSALNSKNLWRPSVLWLTFGGAGLLRPAPGTWGSLAALAVWWWGLSDLPVFVQVAVFRWVFRWLFRWLFRWVLR